MWRVWRREKETAAALPTEMGLFQDQRRARGGGWGLLLQLSLPQLEELLAMLLNRQGVTTRVCVSHCGCVSQWQLG